MCCVIMLLMSLIYISFDIYVLMLWTFYPMTYIHCLLLVLLRLFGGIDCDLGTFGDWLCFGSWVFCIYWCLTDCDLWVGGFVLVFEFCLYYNICIQCIYFTNDYRIFLFKYSLDLSTFEILNTYTLSGIFYAIIHSNQRHWILMVNVDNILKFKEVQY